MVFTSVEKWSEETDTQIGRANAVLCEFFRSVVAHRELLNTEKVSFFKSVFVPILAYGHESCVLTENILSQAGPTLAGVGPNARPRRGAPLNCGAITSSCSANHAMTFSMKIF